MTSDEIFILLVNALALSMKVVSEDMELDNQEQADMVRYVISHLGNEFFDNQAFNDLEIGNLNNNK